MAAAPASTAPIQRTSAERLALFKQHAALLLEMSLDKRKSATTKWQIEDQNQPRYFNSQPPSYDTARAAVRKLHQHQAMSYGPQLWPTRQSLRSTSQLPYPPLPPTHLRDVDEFDPFQSEGTGAAYHMPTHAAYRGDAAYPPRAAARYR